MKINATERALGLLGTQPQRNPAVVRSDSAATSRDVEAARATREVTRDAGLAATQTVNETERAKDLASARDAQQKDRAVQRVEEKQVETKQAKNESRDEARAEQESQDRSYDQMQKGRRVDVLA